MVVLELSESSSSGSTEPLQAYWQLQTSVCGLGQFLPDRHAKYSQTMSISTVSTRHALSAPSIDYRLANPLCSSFAQPLDVVVDTSLD
jgi:hypothetical protein